MAHQALKKETPEEVVPMRPMSLFNEMERMFEGLTPYQWMRSHLPEHKWMKEVAPEVDIIDRDDHIVVRAAVPGISKDNLEVSTTDHSVTIRGHSEHESREEKDEFYRCEISKGNFLRTLTLPAYVDEDKAEASFKDGMLELTLPKRESAKRHTIDIKEEY